MKRRNIFLLALALFVTLFAAACTAPQSSTGPETTPDAETSALAESPYAPEDFASDSAVRILFDHEVYDKSMSAITYYISNESGDDIEFGAEYTIERFEAGTWRTLPVIDNLAWNAIAYILPSGAVRGDTFSFSIYDCEITDGRYRIVKQVGEELLCAEFSLGESPITAQTPFGYMDLADLPHDYSAEQAAADGVVTLYYDDAEDVNAEKLADFVSKLEAGAPAMVRLMSYTVEGDMILTDVVYDTRCFTLRVDATRDEFAAERTITEQCFAYLTAHDGAVFLSDTIEMEYETADRRPFYAQSAWLFDIDQLDDGDALAARIGSLAEGEMLANVIRARYYNAEAKRYIGLTDERLTYIVGSEEQGSWGVTNELPLPQQWMYEADYAITRAEWLASDECILTVECADETKNKYFVTVTIDETKEPLFEKIVLSDETFALGYGFPDGEFAYIVS